MYQRAPEHQRALEDVASHILEYISSETSLSQAVGAFRLTRDKEEDQGQLRQLEQLIRPHLPNMRLTVRGQDVPTVLGLAYDELIGLGPLAPAWRDDEVTEILVDAWNRVYVEHNGRLLVTNASFHDVEHANSIARNLARMVSDRALSPTNPLVTAQLDGARVNFAYQPVVASGLAISLRKFKPLMGMSSLVRANALSPEMAEFLRDAVQARATVLVSGGTGVGKTTLVNALSESIPDNERVITIEDAFELKLANRFVVSMQTKERASFDDNVLINQEKLLENALRMRPDRIVVGEIRDGGAAVTMLQAANTGHDGTMTTIHANSTESALNSRLANLVRSGSARDGSAGVGDDIAKMQIAEAFDLVLQGRRRRQRRFVEEIAEVGAGAFIDGRLVPRALFRTSLDSQDNPVFERVGGLRPDGDLAEKMREAGIDPGRWLE